MNYRSVHKKIWRYIKGALPTSVFVWILFLACFDILTLLYTGYGYLRVAEYLSDPNALPQSVVTSPSPHDSAVINEKLLHDILERYTTR